MLLRRTADGQTGKVRVWYPWNKPLDKAMNVLLVTHGKQLGSVPCGWVGTGLLSINHY